ncbi:MAG: response regulator transcription factor [Anaerolinea sp.]|nr:response regulator transcription factor [Anaerolinea sp.]
MRILLADDQVTVRSALRLLLEQEPHVEIIGESADATAVLQAIERVEPDLILLDWELPGLSPVQLLRLLRYERPLLRIIALSSRPEARKRALAAHVDAFVSKSAPPEELLAAVRIQIDGGYDET